MVHVIAVSRVSKTKSLDGYQNCVVLFPLEGGAGQFGIIWELVNRTYLLTALVLGSHNTQQKLGIQRSNVERGT